MKFVEISVNKTTLSPQFIIVDNYINSYIGMSKKIITENVMNIYKTDYGV